MTHFDVAIVGTGIVGLANAWMATRRGLSVLALDRSPQPQGASVRNFGMVLPLGQPAGELYETALRSRELWLELAEAEVLPVQCCGSILLAYREDELAVLEEFVDLDSQRAEMLTPNQVLERAPCVVADGLLGGMWSGTELRVDPRRAATRIADWLQSTRGVTIEFNTQVIAAEDHQLRAADGRSWEADRIIICAGHDLQTLHPRALSGAGLRLCKLQMLQARSESSWTAACPHLGSGLTLRQYASFRPCPSLHALEQRIAMESPELNQYGVHVMASVFPDGRIILGDSHEYDQHVTDFDNPLIDELILRELRRMLALEDWTIHQRWHGFYAKHEELPVVAKMLGGGVEACLGTGGAGMTMSFGLAEKAWIAREREHGIQV